MASKNIQTKIITSLSQLNQPHSIKFFENLLFLNGPSFPSSSASRLSQGALILTSFFRSFANSAHALSLDKAEGRLLLRILESFNWDHYGAFEPLVQSYCDVLMHSSALYPERIPLFFDFLVKWLCFEAKKEETETKEIKGIKFEKCEKGEKGGEAQKAIIRVLGEMCSLVPLSVDELNKVLVKRFPFGTSDKGALATFVRNLCRLSVVVPSLSEGIISLVIAKTMELDLDFAAKTDNNTELPIFGDFVQSRLGDFESDSAAFIGKYLLSPNEPTAKGGFSVDSGLNETKEKIVAILRELFLHLKKIEPDAEKFDAAFILFLVAFDRKILLSDALCLTPLITFHLVSFSESYAEKFIRLLLNRLGDKSRDLKVRKNSTYYLTALVVRARFIKKFTLVKVFEFLLSFAEWLNINNEPSSMLRSTDNLSSEGKLFYAVAEGVMSIFVHRYAEIHELHDFSGFVSRLCALSHSRLCPLRFCARPVVLEFSAVVSAQNHFDVFAVLVCCFRFFSTNRAHSRLGDQRRFYLSDRSPFPLTSWPQCKFLTDRYISDQVFFFFSFYSVETVCFDREFGNFWEFLENLTLFG